MIVGMASRMSFFENTEANYPLVSPTRKLARRELLSRLLRIWWLKMPGVTLFIWIFFDAYFWLLRYPHTEVIVMPLTWIDRELPMQAWSWWPYLSLWLYTSLPPALLISFRHLLFYGAWIASVCGIGLICFYVWPTVIPPLGRAIEAVPSLVAGIDASGNACPSLHVAVAVFSAFWLSDQLREVGANRFSRIANVVWCAAIVYSTLATKQHVLLDVLAGSVLGGISGYVSLLAFRQWRSLGANGVFS
jgi:membrane-associated phospholipid phosphatase